MISPKLIMKAFQFFREWKGEGGTSISHCICHCQKDRGSKHCMLNNSQHFFSLLFSSVSANIQIKSLFFSHLVSNMITQQRLSWATLPHLPLILASWPCPSFSCWFWCSSGPSVRWFSLLHWQKTNPSIKQDSNC